MISQINKTDRSYKNLEKQIQLSKSPKEIKGFYRDFIDEYKQLDSEFRFTEAFDEDFVLSQINEQIKRPDSPLFCIPVGVKDIFNTKVLPTSMGSEIWKGFKAGNNSRVVDEVYNHGGIIFSKTTTAEFAVHFISPEKTINPHNRNHITGTSSSGSAVAVACGALPVALGTQTAGSIIRPASFCGVYGFKPSFGAIDRTGVLKTNDTLDTIGLLGSDIYGLRKVFYNVLQKGKDYPFSVNYFNSFKNYKAKTKGDLKIGVLTDEFAGFKDYDENVKSQFAGLINILEKSFNVAEVKDVGFINEIHTLHEHIYSKSLSYYFKNEIQHYNSVSDVMRDMIGRGEKIKTEEYIEAIQVQPILRNKFDAAFQNFDFIITPSTASVAPELNEKEKKDSCLIWSFLGYPAISLPMFMDSNLNLPFGLQIVAKKFDDFCLLDYAEVVYDLYSEGGSL